jgi:DNA polymerase-1
MHIDLTIAAFDAGIPEWRMQAVPSYKANRGEKPPELTEQLKMSEELCDWLGVHSIKREKTEADDLLYTLALRCSENNQRCFIASGDKDIAQCLTIPNTTLLRPPKKTADPWDKINRDTAKDVFGVPPEKIAEFLALVGDKVDNLPGIEGVGPKTAIKWLEDFNNLTGVLENKTKLKPERLQEKVNQELLEKNLIITRSYDTGDKLPEIKQGHLKNSEKLRELGIYKVAMRLEGSWVYRS